MDPSKFGKATNSYILNSGLWIQTEASLIISILYILFGIKKSSQRWTLLENFKEIDDEFQKSFYLQYYYVQVQQYVVKWQEIKAQKFRGYVLKWFTVVRKVILDF